MTTTSEPPTTVDTQLRAFITIDPRLRERISAAVYNARWNDPSSTAEQLQAPVPIDDLARAVASNATIFAKVKAALPDNSANPSEAIRIGVVDSDLEYVLLAADGTGAVDRLKQQEVTPLEER